VVLPLPISPAVSSRLFVILARVEVVLATVKRSSGVPRGVILLNGCYTRSLHLLQCTAPQFIRISLSFSESEINLIRCREIETKKLTESNNTF